MADPRIRQIKIKTGVVKRLTKEKGSYEKEVTEQEARIQKLKDNNADEHDIRKQTEVLQECRMMIPDTKKRLRVAHDELEQMLQKESDLEGQGEYGEAKKMLEAAVVVLSS